MYKENRENLINNLKKKFPDTKNSFILLKGSIAYPEYDADTNYNRISFDANIQYLFGI